MKLVAQEFYRLVEDYNKCPHVHIKEQILIDIELLKDALLLTNIDLELKPLDNK
ncbi:hypothetical protein [Psychrobacillus lasiicapitis]|uniref:hypothetical protein n=1 Tax=Psychrobacillus lasiicapitis TaxID=1636719 RepID=UPI001476D039|nr:hypothetical protein [Psychrobacillus lasiicapitis]GGA31884.1 hypothetical protein GCM10011384_21800 [Psychrobacillus lasiicapitis]